MNKSNPEVVGDKIPHAVDPRGVNAGSVVGMDYEVNLETSFLFAHLGVSTNALKDEIKKSVIEQYMCS